MMCKHAKLKFYNKCIGITKKPANLMESKHRFMSGSLKQFSLKRAMKHAQKTGTPATLEQVCGRKKAALAACHQIHTRHKGVNNGYHQAEMPLAPTPFLPGSHKTCKP
jgi:hypothetical protein